MRAFLLSGLLLLGGAARAAETISYTYDARGRLIRVDRSGTVNNGLAANYAYDHANNRISKTETDGGAATPTFAINDMSAIEGAAITFTVTKYGPAGTSNAVSYATANGTATAGADYTAMSGTLTFAAAETAKTVTVSTTDDTAVEGSETFQINLSSPTGGANIADAQALGTIDDNDVAPPTTLSLSISNASAAEGATLFFTVTKSGPATGSVSVNYATSHITTGNLDYTAETGTLTFTASETAKSISIATHEDSFTEGDETMAVDLSNATGGAVITDGHAVGTILDDDGGSCPTC